MSYVLAKQRDSDVVAAFRRYRHYLAQNASSFPPSAYDLATSDWYFDPQDHRSPHDAWLESAVLEEIASDGRQSDRISSLKIRLLGAYHDGHIEFVYPNVRAYTLDMASSARGHGDWRFDEFRVTDSGRIIHEIEWAQSSGTGRWIIEASDVFYTWIPRAAA
jgi:hypothetical protein